MENRPKPTAEAAHAQKRRLRWLHRWLLASVTLHSPAGFTYTGQGDEETSRSITYHRGIMSVKHDDLNAVTASYRTENKLSSRHSSSVRPTNVRRPHFHCKLALWDAVFNPKKEIKGKKKTLEVKKDEVFGNKSLHDAPRIRLHSGIAESLNAYLTYMVNCGRIRCTKSVLQPSRLLWCLSNHSGIIDGLVGHRRDGIIDRVRGAFCDCTTSAPKKHFLYTSSCDRIFCLNNCSKNRILETRMAEHSIIPVFEQNRFRECVEIKMTSIFD